MTLILSLITKDYVMQVCDRRLVFTSPRLRVKDDNALKAVLFNYHTTFGYTGLAELPRSQLAAAARGAGPKMMATNMWLAEVLTLGDDLQASLDHVRREASTSIAQLGSIPAKYRRQAFVGVGFMNREANAPLEPALYEMHNFDVLNVFGLNVITLGDAQFGSHSSIPLPNRIRGEHDRNLTACFRRGLGPAVIGRVLVDTVRKVARTNMSVGMGVLQICIPRSQVEGVISGGNWSIGAREPDLAAMSFRHIPARSDDGFQHGPTVVLEDKSIFGQISLGPGMRPIEVNRQPRVDG